MLKRDEVISQVLELFHDPSYLEVGVNRGETFNNLRACKKVAVDPVFLFDINAYSTEKSLSFYQITSDKFFAEYAKDHGSFDVVYLDGLHTYEQTLRDLMNAIAFLKRDGVIIIDDVLPTSYDASLPDFSQVRALRQAAAICGVNWSSDKSWMGDVFKIPFFIQSYLQQLSYATVAENHGQAIVWHQTRPDEAIQQLSMEKISRLDYRDTILSRSAFNVRPMAEIISLVKAAQSELRTARKQAAHYDVQFDRE